MKIFLSSTTKMVSLVVDGHDVPARVWEGLTESGIPIHCYVTRLAVRDDLDQTQFVRELEPHREPTAAIDAIPLRLII